MQKTPKTDSGDKHSAKGLVRVDMDENGELVLKDQCTMEEFEGGLFEVVYRDGKLIKPHTFSEIRNRLGFNV